ncbi:hypothetical protein E2K80_01305 [Rhodophyticola sp. CCM32]|uniref:hypothetical protein n=1 Tax=Rhodophyticola sp. CCM32 TaxID=2916397 RepID=UPI00107F2CB2|nr:hypothetical protein [Rhodophyticola sp. CCM32]QBX99530.1 hypothetical protein E2K80_01305 [Rhodophyticola sp. CCM32]
MGLDLYAGVTHEDYPVGHSWYYRLGGETLKPKAIRAEVIASGYEGYRGDEIEAIDQMAEPVRSQKLRALNATVPRDLKCDLARYRQIASDIRRLPRNGIIAEHPISSCPYMAISLKYAHLSNSFAHLTRLEKLLTQQGDLFG